MKIIPYVMGILATIIVSVILWTLIIGDAQSNGNTVYKEYMWSIMSESYGTTYLIASDTNGTGYAKRTKSVWDSCSEQEIRDTRSLTTF